MSLGSGEEWRNSQEEEHDKNHISRQKEGDVDQPEHTLPCQELPFNLQAPDKVRAR